MEGNIKMHLAGMTYEGLDRNEWIRLAEGLKKTLR
jgi:hypothetical protein